MMRNSALKLFVFAVAFAALLHASRAIVIPHIGSEGPFSPPTMQLNLDLPPYERWQAIVQAYRNPLWEIYAELNWFIPISFDPVFQAISFWAKHIFKYQEMSQELQGISAATDIPFGKLFFINLMYEFSTIQIGARMCTSTVVRNTTNHILHGRNMDFSFWNRLARIQGRIQFYRGGKYIATIDSYVGSVWALTGFKENAFSVTVDTRYPRGVNESFPEVMRNVFINQYTPSAWLVRQTVMDAPDFATARAQLMGGVVTAPIYYIVAGLSGNEGTVIEKQPVGVHAYYDLNETAWYLVQTNYDRDVPDPYYDRRRIPAERRLNNIGQSITIQDLYSKVMIKYPTLNIETVMTFSSVPSLGYNKTVVWYPTVNSSQVTVGNAPIFFSE